MVRSRAAVIPAAGTLSRRSPRNHASPPTPRPNLNVKPAIIPWDDDPELQASLMSALETNRRWRIGNFNPCEPKNRYEKAQHGRHRDLCCEEMARALLLRHPIYQHDYRSRPHAFARAFRDKLDSLASGRMFVMEKYGGNNIPLETTEALNYTAATWKIRRSILERNHSDTILNTAWTPLLPLDLQLLVVELLIHDTCDGSLDWRTALSLCFVNATWMSWIDLHLYQDVTVKNVDQHKALLGPAGKLYRPWGAGSHVKTLRVHWIPDKVYCRGDFRLRVDEFHHDMSRSRQELPPSTAENYASRIQHYAGVCIPLYQLIVDVEAETLRLTWDDDMEVAERAHRLFWRDLLGAHLASLKLMTRCQHLIISGGAYLQLLPSVVTAWCHVDNWQVILDVLRDQNIVSNVDGPMPTMLDESTVSKLTLIHREVPTLAILAEMAQGTQVKVIELVGWDMDPGEGIPKEWSSFLESEKARKQDERGSIVKWMQSSGVAL